MPTFVLCHSHRPAECRFAYAAWHGFASPLRHGEALASCPVDDGATPGTVHRIFWTVEADDAVAAVGYLPAYLASRTEVVRVADTPIP